MNPRTILRALALPAAIATVSLAAGPASGHVTISPSDGQAGAYTVLTASVPHGCDGSATTEVVIRMPEEVLAVTPTRNPSWEVEKVVEKLADPVEDAHGNQITERVAQVVYTAQEPLPEGYRDAFELSLQLPDTPGETLVFPVIQRCEEGETAWIETAADGETEELEAPAPTVTLLAPAGEDTEAATTVEDEDSDALTIAALVAGLLGLAAGVLALVVARRRA